jgi:N-methylhydantoinase A
MSLLLAIDTGGTFTDLVACDTATGELHSTKSLTDYDDLVEGVARCLVKAGVQLSKAESAKFGTTLVINSFLQRRGARTALVTTAGFRDVLHVRRGNRPVPFDLRFAYDPALVPRRLCFELSERLAADGSVLRVLDQAELAALAETLRSEQVEAVAISFLHGWRNPVHERQAATWLRAELPGVFVTAGSDLSREWHEYERASTAAANAYVGPLLADYIDRMNGRLRHDGASTRLLLMASNGGACAVARAREQPVALVESGPVGGCIGAAAYARALGLNRVIAFDMGGTTAKCALVADGAFEVTSPYYVGGRTHGFPVRGAVVDIVEVGAGGGSIAWLDEGGRLSVGPRSAGSTPGPVCYGMGGSEPTITDANLVLGRIDPAGFQGGEMMLDEAGAADALRRQVAEPLGYQGATGLDAAAQGIIDLGTIVMASAIKRVTIERGHDPRDFVLFVFGGGGALHGAALARELAIPAVLVPPHPGVFSALGMLLADARSDATATFLRPLDAAALAPMLAEFARMEQEAEIALRQDGVDGAIRFERLAEMRFRGQRQAMKASLGAAHDIGAIRAAFIAAYQQRTGHVDQDGPLEFVNLLVTATADGQKPALAGLVAPPAEKPRPTGQRQVGFGQSGRLNATLWRREDLPAGFEAAGPALIEEYGTTTLVGPTDHFRIGALGEIWITIDG